MVRKIYQEIGVKKFDKGDTDDNLFVPVEHVVKIVLNYQDILELTCLEEHLEEYIIGFLFSEGIIDEISDIENLEFSKDFKTAFVYTRDKTKEKEYRNKIKRIVTGCHGGLIGGSVEGKIRSKN